MSGISAEGRRELLIGHSVCIFRSADGIAKS